MESSILNHWKIMFDTVVYIFSLCGLALAHLFSCTNNSCETCLFSQQFSEYIFLANMPSLIASLRISVALNHLEVIRFFWNFFSLTWEGNKLLLNWSI